MDVRAFLDELTTLQGNEDCLAHVEVLPVRDPSLEELPDVLGLAA